jgi:hypothetical protein
VEITQDSMRFCSDIFFRARSDDDEIAARLANWEVPDATVRQEADRLRTLLAAGYDGPAAVLFVGQIDIDSSLIADAALTRVDRFVTNIRQTLNSRKLLLKPHPSDPKRADLLTLYEHFPESRFIAGNIYSLLASPAIDQVVILSSSVAAEAPMSDKPVLQLITPDVHRVPPETMSRFHRVDARVTSIALWGDVLDGMPSFMFLDTPPSPLRRLFSMSWGYARDMTTPVSRQIADGEVISFATSGRGRDLCLFGWSEPEPWGVWSDGTVALLQFDPSDDFPTFVIEIAFAPFVPGAAHSLSLTIRPRAGVPLEVIATIFNSDIVTIVRIPITSRQGPVELLFRLSERISPSQLGTADDSRLLGVGLDRLTIRRATAS